MSALHETIHHLYSIVREKRIALVFVYMSSRHKQNDFFEELNIHSHYESIDSLSSINLKLENEDFQSVQSHIDQGGKLSLDDIYIHTLPSLISAKERVNLYSRDPGSIERIINKSDVNNSIYILSQDAHLLTKGEEEVEKVKPEHQELLSRAERTYTEYAVEERGITAIGPIEQAPSQTLSDIFKEIGPVAGSSGDPTSGLQPASGSGDSLPDDEKMEVVNWFKDRWKDGPTEMVTKLAEASADKWNKDSGHEFSQFKENGEVNESRARKCTSLFEKYLKTEIEKWFIENSGDVINDSDKKGFGSYCFNEYMKYTETEPAVNIYSFFDKDGQVHEQGFIILGNAKGQPPESFKISKKQRKT